MLTGVDQRHIDRYGYGLLCSRSSNQSCIHGGRRTQGHLSPRQLCTGIRCQKRAAQRHRSSICFILLGPAEAASKPGWREDSERVAGREISPLACWANTVGKRAGRAVRLTSNEIHSPTSRYLNNRRGKDGGAQGFSIGNIVLRIHSAGAEHTVDKRCN